MKMREGEVEGKTEDLYEVRITVEVRSRSRKTEWRESCK